MAGVGSGRIDPRGFTQNITGNPNIDGPEYHFRSVGRPYSHRAPGLPYNWSGGDFGIEADGPNPIRPIDQSGRQVAIPKEPTYRPPYIVHFDSDDRDTSAFPLPTSFRLNFDTPLRGVYSIELLSLNVANTPQDVPPNGRYFWLALGLSRGTGGSTFVRTECVPGDGIFHTMRNTSQVAGTGTRTFGEYSLAKLEYITGLPFQHFQKRELRMIKHLYPFAERVSGLELSLIDRNGMPYDLPDDESWHGTLEIVSKA